LGADEIAILERIRSGAMSADSVRGKGRPLGRMRVIAAVFVILFLSALMIGGIMMMRQRRAAAPAAPAIAPPAGTASVPGS
jgi:uncharacterized iron-regulated membrane protein